MRREGFSKSQERRVTGSAKMREFDELMAEIDDPSIQAHIESLTDAYWNGYHIGQPTEGMMQRKHRGDRRGKLQIKAAE